jgi:peroxiredoxin Q/BCP
MKQAACVTASLAACVVASVALVASCAKAHAAELQVGDPAPAFSLAGSDGKTHQLSEYRGRNVVLAWFPKAFTSG